MTTKTINKIKIFVGISALCLLFSFNLMHALNDYGVSNPNNTLHPQVYAQTNTAGNGGGSTPGNGDISNPGGGTPPGGCTPGCCDSVDPPRLGMTTGRGEVKYLEINYHTGATEIVWRQGPCCVRSVSTNYCSFSLPVCRRYQ